MQGTWVQSLVREQRPYMLHGVVKNFKLIKTCLKKKRMGNTEDRTGGYMQSRTNHCESQKSKKFFKIKQNRRAWRILGNYILQHLQFTSGKNKRPQRWRKNLTAVIPPQRSSTKNSFSYTSVFQIFTCETVSQMKAYQIVQYKKQINKSRWALPTPWRERQRKNKWSCDDERHHRRKLREVP